MNIQSTRVRQICILTTILVLAAGGVFAQSNLDGTPGKDEDTVERIAVLQFEGAGVTSDMLDTIKQAVEEALFGVEGFLVIEREQVDVILAEQEFQLSDIVDESSAVQIGQLLAADTVVTGSINRLGDINLNVKFLDVETAEVSFIGTQTITNISAIADASKRIARDAEKAFFPDRFQPLKLVAFVGGGLAIPVGSLAELTGLGIHSVAAFYFQNLGINFVDIGIEVHFQSLPGFDVSPADWYRNVPILITGGYRFQIGELLYIRPYISGGVTVSILRYDPDGFVFGAEDPEYENLSAVYGQVGPGIVVGYRLKSLAFELGSQFEIVFGSSKPVMILPVWVLIGLNL